MITTRTPIFYAFPTQKDVDISPTSPLKQCDTILVFPGSPTSHDFFPHAW
jgi:hypothetical protein